MLKIRDGVDLKELEKFGFDNNIFTRTIQGQILYQVVITSNHKYIQVRNANCDIAGSLQTLLYDLIQADLVVKVDE